MIDCPKIELGQLTTTINGLWTGKKPPFKTVAVIRNTNFSKDCRLNMEDVALIDVEERQFATRKLQVGDIIIEKSGGSDKQPVGRPVIFNIPDGDYSFSNFTSVLRVNDTSRVLPEYLQRFLYKFYLTGKTAEMQSKTTGLRNLDFNTYKKILVPIPSIDKQKHIVDELDSIVAIIEQKDSQLLDLDALIRSVYEEMFGPSSFGFDSWETRSIRDVCTLKSGNSDANNSQSGDLPYVKVGDMNIKGNERYITTSSKFVDRKSNLKGIFPIGTTIFPKRGGAIYTNKKRLTTVEICCDLNTMGVIPDKDIIHPYYLYQYFLNLDLGSLCNGAAIPQLNNCDIGPLMIRIPPMERQIRFASMFDSIEAQRRLIEGTIHDFEILFNSRMDYWFN